MDPSASSKTYWSILITFLKGKKVPCITPIFHENKLFTDLKGTEIFNIIFSNQYKILENANQTHLNSSTKTDQLLSDISVTNWETLKIFQNLDPTKPHGHNMISIQMIEICGTCI